MKEENRYLIFNTFILALRWNSLIKCFHFFTLILDEIKLARVFIRRYKSKHGVDSVEIKFCRKDKSFKAFPPRLCPVLKQFLHF